MERHGEGRHRVSALNPAERRSDVRRPPSMPQFGSWRDVVKEGKGPVATQGTKWTEVSRKLESRAFTESAFTMSQ